MDIKYYTISLDKILISIENEGNQRCAMRGTMANFDALIFASAIREEQG